jgi:hypothetical protein
MMDWLLRTHCVSGPSASNFFLHRVVVARGKRAGVVHDGSVAFAVVPLGARQLTVHPLKNHG